MKIKDFDFGLVITDKQTLACSFDKWYNKFNPGKDESHTFPSTIIPLNPDFISYLKHDMIFLPLRSSNTLKPGDPRSTPQEKYWIENECDLSEKNKFSFQEIESKIDSALVIFSDEVFVKLNWTSPKDSFSLVGGISYCNSPGQIFLLLKLSDLCKSDLGKLDELNYKPVLVLRKYVEMNPSLEFRCFVYMKKLKVICQRDPSMYYAFLNDSKLQELLRKKLQKFIEELVVDNFCPNGSGFIVDVYVDCSSNVDIWKCWVIDFSPLPEKVDLYSMSEEQKKQSSKIFSAPPHSLIRWDDIFGSQKRNHKFAVVPSTASVDFSERNAIALNRVPYDFVVGRLTSSTVEECYENFSKISG